MPPSPYSISGFLWDGINEDHIEEHIHGWLVDEMLLARQFQVFPNTKNYPPNQFIYIGPTESGTWVTAIVEYLDEVDAWRPITAWHSTETELRRYQNSVPMQRRKKTR